MSFELEGVNQFSAEVEQDSAVQPQQPPANPVAEELNDTELDAIAGGAFGWFESAIGERYSFDHELWS